MPKLDPSIAKTLGSEMNLNGHLTQLNSFKNKYEL